MTKASTLKNYPPAKTTESNQGFNRFPRYALNLPVRCFFGLLVFLNNFIFFSANTNAICGNRIKEEGEECDCGWESECTEGCCNPQTDTPGAETPCTRKSTAVCRYALLRNTVMRKIILPKVCIEKLIDCGWESEYTEGCSSHLGILGINTWW